MSEESPEVEEKEEFGCWICDERMGFKKLVTHLRNHTETEKMLAYTTQTTQERKERDEREKKGKKNGKTGQGNAHLPQGQDALSGEACSGGVDEDTAAPVLDSAERHDQDLSNVSGREQASKVELPKAAKRASASIASL
jgi:hypothetical protein